MKSETGSVPSHLQELLDDLKAFRLAGHLDRRRTDLMSITGYGRDEIAHSHVIRWLLDPEGSHGLGSTLLRAILVQGWGTDAAAEVHLAIADREVTRLKTRADVIVDLGSSTLVIENKVDAPEQERQCENFFRHWGTRGRFLFVSGHGQKPESAKSAACREAWRTLAYGSLAHLIAIHLADATGPGRVALADYLEALRRQFPPQNAFTIGREDHMSDAPARDPGPVPFDAPDPFDTPRLRFFLSHRPALADVEAIRKEFKGELERELQGLYGPIQQVLTQPHDPIEADALKWGGGQKHPMFWRPSWVGRDRHPRAAIGLAWDRLDPTRNGVYTGMFVRDTSPGSALDRILREDHASAPPDHCVPGLYPVAYQYVVSQADWWMDIPRWRANLGKAVVNAWARFAPRVEAAITQLGPDLNEGREPEEPAEI